MKLSYEWIREYVDLEAGPEELAGRLTMSGTEVEIMHEAGPDKVMEMEITSNRPDCLSILGLAREASVVFDKELKVPEFGIPRGMREEKGPEVECVIKNPKLCPKYTARVITDVKVKPAAGKIRKRIEALDLRPVNNIVDLTNYCLMELGQPLHAFDLDKIKDGKIIVREAKKGEKIITIDGVERGLETGMLVIADTEKPVAIAGIMGGKDTEVSGKTRNILLESAYFDPVSIRRTGRRLGLSSDSSYRFERGVDRGMIQAASDRAARFIVEETGGKLCGFYEAGALSIDEIVIEFDVKRAGGVLGVELEKTWVKQVFQRLGMIVTDKGGTKIAATVPAFREDIESEIDLIEEIARIFGYEKVPPTIPQISPVVDRKETPRQVKERLLENLTSLGLNEIMAYSLISSASANRFPSLVEAPVELSNPLSEEQKVMTPHLLDGMLKAISWNINRKNKDLMLFEFGKVYSKHQIRGYEESEALCIGLTGCVRENWLEGKRSCDFYNLKGIVERQFHELKIIPEFIPLQVEGIAPCAGMKIQEEEAIGFLGQVTNKALKAYDIEQEVFISQIKLESIFEKAVLENRYRAVPRFPFSVRDISILCDASIASKDILNVIAQTGEELIREVDFVDVYQGKNIPQGKKSLTYSIKYGLGTRTLKEEEIEFIHSKVKDTLMKELGVTFR